jgi:2-iminobutanoate/2-iminopropanoate deaminase
MAECVSRLSELAAVSGMSEGERREMLALGLINQEGDGIPYSPPAGSEDHHVSVERHAISAPSVLNEAFHYARPSSFSRGLRVELGTYTLLLISGTASVDEDGRTAHVGDFRAQCWRTYRNITELLASEGATWQDVIRTTCYLRDIERDYKDFNEIRTMFFGWLGLDPLPASTGIQARICREDLLVEIEAMGLYKRRTGS